MEITGSNIMLISAIPLFISVLVVTMIQFPCSTGKTLLYIGYRLPLVSRSEMSPEELIK